MSRARHAARMEMTASTFVYRHTRLGILTERPADIVDLTDGLDSMLADTAVTTGIVTLRPLAGGADILVAGAAPAQPSHQGPPHSDACLPIVDGRLQLGAGERVFLIDFAGPAAREIAIVLIGEGRR
jgi:thiamine phosphate synthase YjbQ (UPF0047 family)